MRIYKPEDGSLREIISGGTTNGVITWGIGGLVGSENITISDTAPIAAANSFGSGLQEKIVVYCVSRDNHLRAFEFIDRQWALGNLDVPLSRPCVSLHATWYNVAGVSGPELRCF